MRPDHDAIRQALVTGLPAGVACCVAFSGGRDSTVLLHALSRLHEAQGFRLRAVHVNHGLQPGADDWERHAVAVAGRLGVPVRVERIVVPTDRGHGVEAAAREARYAALRQGLAAGERLLTAHHADDQLETVLLHLLRGSGVAGLAGIPREAPFGPGQLCRPLLGVTADDVAAYARAILEPEGIEWLTDPMNAERAYDRAFLRHEVTPVLRRRFPAAAGAAARSAALAAEAAELLNELACADDRLTLAGGRIALAALGQLSPARQRNLVRWLARERGWAIPPERRLREGLAQLLAAAPGRQPVLRWNGHEIRRYREHLYLLEAGVPAVADSHPLDWSRGEPLALGGVRGRLALARREGGGLAPAIVSGGLEVTFRSGGERFRAGDDRHHRTLKYLFQSHGIVPWMRAHIPLVLARGTLAAVADLWTADWAAAAPGESGHAIVWTGHAPIH